MTLSVEIEGKIMTKKRFSLAVEKLVASRPGVSYIDAAVAIIEERGMDYSNLKRLFFPDGPCPTYQQHVKSKFRRSIPFDVNPMKCDFLCR